MGVLQPGMLLIRNWLDRTTLGALAVLAGGLLLSYQAYRYVDRSEQAAVSAEMEKAADRQARAIAGRMRTYEQVLRGGVGLFEASASVSREAWREYVAEVDLRQHYPGIQGMGYAPHLTPTQVAAQEAEVRADGYSDFRVFPAGERSVYTPILYLEPFDRRNQRAFGYDMYSEAVRREAMQRAARTASAALSGPVTLVQEDGSDPQVGFLLYLPLYEKREPSAQRTLKGYVYAPFRMGDFLAGALGREESDNPLSVEDVTAETGGLLYRSGVAGHEVSGVVRELDLFGRSWRLHSAGSAAVTGNRSWAVWVLSLGALVSLMLFITVHSLGSSARRARAMALEMTDALRLSEAGQRAIVDSSSEGIVTIDTGGIVQSFNRAAERMFGYPAAEVIGRNVSRLMPSRFRAAHDGYVRNFQPVDHGRIIGLRREVVGLRRDGSEFPMSLSINVIDSAGPRRFVGVIADISERKRHEEYIRHIAQHDDLTQLPNRALLQDRIDAELARAQRTESLIGVLMIDLDHFKRINDSLGHHVGDQVLLTVAERLTHCVRGIDSVARMGGDEFVILLTGLSDTTSIDRVAENVIAAFRQPITVGNHDLLLSASVGSSQYPKDGVDCATLLKNADTAMYQAKAAGRGCYRSFSAEMMHAVHEKLTLEGAMRQAMSRGEFSMHYEPQISLDTGEVTGMEALIRWNHPQRGLISPAEFIPVAEETGLIIAIGEWTLRTVCQEARQIQQRLNRPLTVAVNLSPRQFAQPDLVEQVQRALALSGLEPESLVLEITEGSLMAKSEDTIRVLRHLRLLGIAIAVDDFGTGYSSLSYITRFPVDVLKIDRSFVRDICEDPADAAVAQAIIAMAHGLGIAVVAEGIETVEQLEFLRDRACDSGQGYLVGRGTPAAAFVGQGHYFAKARPAQEVSDRVVTLGSGRHRGRDETVF